MEFKVSALHMANPNLNSQNYMAPWALSGVTPRYIARNSCQSPAQVKGPEAGLPQRLRKQDGHDKVKHLIWRLPVLWTESSNCPSSTVSINMGGRADINRQNSYLMIIKPKWVFTAQKRVYEGKRKLMQSYCELSSSWRGDRQNNECMTPNCKAFLFRCLSSSKLKVFKSPLSPFTSSISINYFI